MNVFFPNPIDYLDWEAKQEAKHEYHNGEVIAMSGGTLNHNIISGNIFNCLFNRLQDKGCRPFNSDMKLGISKHKSFVYPDVMVVCAKVELWEERKDAIQNPVLIVEVLSESTESYDRGKKLLKYQSLPSFKEYLLIDSRSTRVDVFFKKSESEWSIFIYRDLSDSVYLQSLDLTIGIESIYKDYNG